MEQKLHLSKSLPLFVILSSLIISTVSGETGFIADKIGPSCTIFSVAIGDTIFFGNNEDYLQRDLYQWYIPSQNISVNGGNKTIYGGVFVGFVSEEGGIYPQGGMNEYGLRSGDVAVWVGILQIEAIITFGRDDAAYAPDLPIHQGRDVAGPLNAVDVQLGIHERHEGRTGRGGCIVGGCDGIVGVDDGRNAAGRRDSEAGCGAARVR